MTKDTPCVVCLTGRYPGFSLGKGMCEKHDVCISCGVKRADIDHTPWAVRDGSFQCAPCEKLCRKAGIEERIAKGFEHEYTDEVVCPHCGYLHRDSWESSEGEMECSDCTKPFTMTRNVSVTYTTESKGQS